MKFRVWWPEVHSCEEESHEIEAHDAEEAAEVFARKYDWDTADYPFANGDDGPVCVRDGDMVRSFRIRVYSDPTYRAEELNT